MQLIAGPGLRRDHFEWNARWEVHKFTDAALERAGIDPVAPTWAELETAMRNGSLAPREVLRRAGNLLMFGGASCLWQCLIGNGSATPDEDLTFFDNTNAHLGVGDSTDAAAATQTDLQAATNKDRQPMEATYPQHTDGETDANNDIIYKSLWGTGEANFSWQEWAIFNSATVGRMLNRKVENLGVKATGTWTLTVTITLS